MLELCRNTFTVLSITLPLLACLQYYEFWTRALEPGRHYVALKTGDKLAMCLDVAEKVGADLDKVAIAGELQRGWVLPC